MNEKNKINKKEEQQLINTVLEYLNILRIPAWRMNSGAFEIQNRFVTFGTKGMSDIIAILPDGKFLAIECKRQDGKVSALQKEFLRIIKENNGEAIIARSLEDLTEITKKYATHLIEKKEYEGKQW